MALFLIAPMGCGSPDSGSDGAAGGEAVQAETAAPSGDAAGEPVPRILFLGTSLTAGLGVDPAQAYPALLQNRMDSLGIRWRAVNAGLSGETSAGALRRLDWLLQGPVRIVVVETGANDGLRGLDPDSTRANIRAIVLKIRQFDPTVRIVLAGMEAPPNLGPRFTARFRDLFAALARSEGLTLVPFLLDGVGGVDSLNQPDGIHPTARGQQIVAETVWGVLEPLLRPTP